MGRLFLRVFLWFWLGSSVLIVVLGLTLAAAFPDAVATWRFIGRTAMRYVGAQLADAYERGGTTAANAIADSAGREGRFRIWLYAPDGRLLAGPAPEAGSQEAVARAIDTEDDFLRAGDARLLARRTTSSSGADYIVMWDAPRALRSALQPSPARFTIRILALLLVGAAVCWILVGHIARPIETLRAAARRVADGDLSTRVGTHRALQRRDELGDLAREFDHMAARIQDLVTSQLRLLADISHELRSPLARLSLALDLARRRLTESVQAPVPEHDRIEREVQRLDDLIQQLLTLARLQARPEEPREDVDLADLVSQVARDAGFEAEAAGRAVILEETSSAIVHGVPHLLRSAIENVVRNAVRHTAEGTTVSIRMTRDRETGRATIVVRDRGPGVPPELLGQLFEPFFRVDEARDRTLGGVGLGLAITKEAIAAHAGTVRAANHPRGGLCVRIDLPVVSR